MCDLCLYLVFVLMFFFFFKQKTAYEMRISDWSSDVCSSDLCLHPVDYFLSHGLRGLGGGGQRRRDPCHAAVPAAHVLGGGGVADRRERPSGRAREIGRASCRERVCQYG